MKIILWLAALMMAAAPTHAQLVKTLFQTFELPDSAIAVSFEIYEQDAFEVVPWAGNTIMTESDIKLYYASRGVFDHLLEQGRYNFESREMGDTLVLASVAERHIKIKLNPGGADEEGRRTGGQHYTPAGDEERNEIVKGRIFIPDDFSQSSPTAWTRPRKEKSEERIGAYRPRKKLARESGGVSDELKEAIPEAPKDTVEEQLVLPMPDSSWRRQTGAEKKTKQDKE